MVSACTSSGKVVMAVTMDQYYRIVHQLVVGPWASNPAADQADKTKLVTRFYQ